MFLGPEDQRGGGLCSGKEMVQKHVSRLLPRFTLLRGTLGLPTPTPSLGEHPRKSYVAPSPAASPSRAGPGLPTGQTTVFDSRLRGSQVQLLPRWAAAGGAERRPLSPGGGGTGCRPEGAACTGRGRSGGGEVPRAPTAGQPEGGVDGPPHPQAGALARPTQSSQRSAAVPRPGTDSRLPFSSRGLGLRARPAPPRSRPGSPRHPPHSALPDP